MPNTIGVLVTEKSLAIRQGAGEYYQYYTPGDGANSIVHTVPGELYVEPDGTRVWLYVDPDSRIRSILDGYRRELKEWCDIAEKRRIDVQRIHERHQRLLRRNWWQRLFNTDWSF
jgi:hypothetical protein